ncbi:FixH family protein [Pseudaminobacter soli (ex Li et al. 2025)]|uniref:Cytochrome oxidase n=1 Tax=Pseudaminobacter soli (ex Li et al. 2025) TaxID=1295366 RepID=A0A2P7RXU6_9HYPH|nr:FixH family protein [Mesorhizobium soli]PSJ55050.1 cytochrome oxidase [Mesorhizobium soli]
MTAAPIRTREFTGWHMLAVMVAFFGVVIAVNIVMAIYANTSWTGLVVQNSYVASQEFNEKTAEARAQAARGWKDKLEIEPGTVSFALADAAGSSIEAKGVTVTFRRPAYEAEDETFQLTRQPDGAYAAEHAVRDGLWVVEIDADIGEARPYRVVHRIVVKQGIYR